MSAWVVAVLWLALAVQASVAQQSVEAGKPPVAAEINFELQRGFLVIVPATIGGIGDLRFAVDTGSARTIIDRRLAKRLKLTGSQVQLAAVNTSIPVPETIAAAFEVGPIRIESVPVLVQDLGFLRKPMGRQVDGILGVDVLGRQVFSLDYRRHKLLVGECLAGNFRLPLVRTTSLVVVPVRVEGKPVNLLVDTGASEMQLHPTKMGVIVPAGERKAYGVGGEFKVNEIVLGSLRLGSDELNAPHAFVVDGKSEETQDFDGLLSPVALGISHMCVDMNRGEFSWSR